MPIPREQLVNDKFTDTAYAQAQEELTAYKFVRDTGYQAGNGESGYPVMFDYNVGDNIALIRSGTANVIAGAAVSEGADVQSDAEGRAITLDAGKKNGRAINSAAQAGDILIISIP